MVSSRAGTDPAAMPKRAIPSSLLLRPRVRLTSGIRGDQLERTALLTKKSSRDRQRQYDDVSDTTRPSGRPDDDGSPFSRSVRRSGIAL